MRYFKTSCLKVKYVKIDYRQTLTILPEMFLRYDICTSRYIYTYVYVISITSALNVTINICWKKKFSLPSERSRTKLEFHSGKTLRYSTCSIFLSVIELWEWLRRLRERNTFAILSALLSVNTIRCNQVTVRRYQFARLSLSMLANAIMKRKKKKKRKGNLLKIIAWHLRCFRCMERKNKRELKK